MEQIKLFTHPDFGNLRTVENEKGIWFVGKDVADVLGYAKARNAIARHVDEDDALKLALTDALGRAQETTIINESGLYSLILGSKLEKAKHFKKWITSEVLPSIRKNGGYISGQEQMTDSEIMAKAILVANKTIEAKNKQIEEMQPKALFADSVASSQTSILIGDLAKLITQNGVNIGSKRLFEWLRDNNYLIKGGSSRNMPTQRYMEQGLFEIKESNLQMPDGSVRINKTTKVTGKGQIYFVNKFLGK